MDAKLNRAHDEIRQHCAQHRLGSWRDVQKSRSCINMAFAGSRERGIMIE
jgi:hypothetical protein